MEIRGVEAEKQIITDLIAGKKYDILQRELDDICKRSEKRVVIRNSEAFRIENDYFLDNIQNKLDTTTESRLNLKKEETLSKELKRLNQNEITDLKIRQHVRETSEELRDIESKLRAAYVQKERAAQMAEKEYLKAQEKMINRKADELLERASASYKELQLKKAEKDIMKKYQYKQELQDQIIVKLKQKEFQYEEFLRDKKALDSIIQRIHDEDRMEMENKMIHLNKTKKEIERFKVFQEMWKQKEREELEDETKRIAEYLKDKERKQRESEASKLKQNEEKDALFNKLATKLYSEQLKKKEREEVIQDLLLEEAREKDEQRLKDEIEKAIQLRTDSQNMMAMQLEMKKEKIKQEELDEAQYRQQLLEKVLEDEKLEQLTAEKRRRKTIEYRRAVEEIIQDRRIKRAEELRHLLYMQEQDQIQADNKKKIIEEERLKLLKHHAQNLIGYLPPGLLREEDLPHLGSNVYNQYKKK